MGFGTGQTWDISISQGFNLTDQRKICLLDRCTKAKENRRPSHAKLVSCRTILRTEPPSPSDFPPIVSPSSDRRRYIEPTSVYLRLLVSSVKLHFYICPVQWVCMQTALFSTAQAVESPKGLPTNSSQLSSK